MGKRAADDDHFVSLLPVLAGGAKHPFFPFPPPPPPLLVLVVVHPPRWDPWYRTPASPPCFRASPRSECHAEGRGDLGRSRVTSTAEPAEQSRDPGRDRAREREREEREGLSEQGRLADSTYGPDCSLSLPPSLPLSLPNSLNTARARARAPSRPARRQSTPAITIPSPARPFTGPFSPHCVNLPPSLPLPSP